jgi:hypothetical protein
VALLTDQHNPSPTPELAAMADVYQELETLPADARNRVLQWATAYFDTDVKVVPDRSVQPAGPELAIMTALRLEPADAARARVLRWAIAYFGMESEVARSLSAQRAGDGTPAAQVRSDAVDDMGSFDDLADAADGNKPSQGPKDNLVPFDANRQTKRTA